MNYRNWFFYRFAYGFFKAKIKKKIITELQFVLKRYCITNELLPLQMCITQLYYHLAQTEVFKISFNYFTNFILIRFFSY